MTFLLGSTLKVSVVVLAGLGVASLLRRRSAATRHWVIAASLLCAMAVPALELALPAWGVPSAWSAAPVVREQPTSGDGAVGGAPPLRTTGRDVVETVSVAPSVSGRTVLSALIAPTWLAGVAVSLFVLTVGLTRLTWLASRARPVEAGTWTRLADEIGRDLALGRPVRLLESDHPSLVVTWGLFVPKVILPRAAQSWTDERAAIVLRHELAHIRRGDWVVQMAGEILRTAYWFNPLVWIACARLRQESRHATTRC
jgi:beta-lactamase regulating signal transducer with metallopeptidase domain